MYQLDDIRKSHRMGQNSEWLDEKIKEFEIAIKREVEGLKDGIRDEIKKKNRKMDDGEAIEKEYNEVKSYRVKDQVNF